jgi:cyclopropane fatty-acyl-phospholipid synthase-like methyltransferase
MVMKNYKEIDSCRVGGGSNLISVLNLGSQVLTGVFPRSASEQVTAGPLELVWCPESGLLQLRHSYNLEEMYGNNYGYRSGLNQSMVNHLSSKVAAIEALQPLSPGDVVLDIGSNDGTTLRAYQTSGIRRIGIDPTGHKFADFYPSDVRLVSDFFSAKAYRAIESKSASVITSIAMFYDLESPVDFARQVESILAPDGIWHFEQSYLPSMLKTNSYDTICHEHLEYYSLHVIKNVLSQSGLRILDVSLNAINGGSFAVTATKTSNKTHHANQPVIEQLLSQEEVIGLKTVHPYREFAERVYKHRDDLVTLVRSLSQSGKKIFGYGASTKGNVLLQFCGFNADDIQAIVEVNPEKFGCITPGTHIPIISEEAAKAMNPDYYLVLPWHFRSGILHRELDYISRGGRFIFPFPTIEVI